jgi:transcriptional regulator
MYLPNHFEEARAEELLRTIAAHPLGALVVNGPHGLDANHVPFLVDETSGGKKLLAHVARASPLCKEARDGDEALVIFSAGDTYISPNWYPSKHEVHRQVPTWNYAEELRKRGEQEISGAMLVTAGLVPSATVTE